MRKLWRYVRHYQRCYFRIAVRLHDREGAGGDLQIFTPLFLLRIADRSEWWNGLGGIMCGLGSGIELCWSPTFIGPDVEGGLLHRKHKQWRMGWIPMEPYPGYKVSGGF